MKRLFNLTLLALMLAGAQIDAGDIGSGSLSSFSSASSSSSSSSSLSSSSLSSSSSFASSGNTETTADLLTQIKAILPHVQTMNLTINSINLYALLQTINNKLINNEQRELQLKNALITISNTVGQAIGPISVEAQQNQTAFNVEQPTHLASSLTTPTTTSSSSSSSSHATQQAEDDNLLSEIKDIYHGENNQIKNPTKAVQLFNAVIEDEKSSSQEKAEAHRFIGHAYWFGEGIEKNGENALKHYKESLRTQDITPLQKTRALFYIGRSYYAGISTIFLILCPIAG